jgi:hypothetical protein
MIDTLLNLLFRCAHRRLTTPFTPVSQAGVPHGATYVVCLDCGKQFAYDLKKMRTGKAIDHSQDSCVLPPKMPSARKANLKYVLWAVPLAVLIGSAMKSRRRRTSSTAGPVRTSEQGNSGHG